MSIKSAQKIRGDVTRDTIVEVAEGFWAEHGIHNASLRQISAAAGLSNPSSVQYHFGGRDGLIQAVFEYRLPPLERRRAELMAEATGRGLEFDLLTLADCIYRPITEVVDAQGRHAYAAFLRQVLMYEPALLLRLGLDELTPHSGQLTEKLLGLLFQKLPAQIARRRLLASSLLLLSLIIRHDQEGDASPLEWVYLDALDVAVACMTQPLRPALRAGLGT